MIGVLTVVLLKVQVLWVVLMFCFSVLKVLRAFKML
jgi:hypothetical protein